MSADRSCENCTSAVMKDYGYSNYTTEGTEFFCGKKLHPAGHFDRFYGEDKRLEFGKECAGYEAGKPIEMDVEEEGLADLTPEQIKIYNLSQAA